MIAVRLIGPKVSFPAAALTDLSLPVTVVPRALGQSLGLPLEAPSRLPHWSGTLSGQLSQVTIAVAGEEDWQLFVSAPVFVPFREVFAVVLGRLGVLDSLRVCIDLPRGWIEMESMGIGSGVEA